MVARVCWETAQRWYEVALVRDLMGDWVLMADRVAKLPSVTENCLM